MSQPLVLFFLCFFSCRTNSPTPFWDLCRLTDASFLFHGMIFPPTADLTATFTFRRGARVFPICFQNHGPSDRTRAEKGPLSLVTHGLPPPFREILDNIRSILLSRYLSVCECCRSVVLDVRNSTS